MKTKLWNILSATAALTLGLAFLPSAQAAVVDGYYTSGNDGYGPTLLIRTVTLNQVESSYALIQWSAKETSLFRIEEIDEVTQAWVQLFQTGDGILGSNVDQTATFSVQSRQQFPGTGKGNSGLILQLAPTDFGNSIGCREAVTFSIQEGKGDQWQGLLMRNPEISGPNDLKATLQPTGKNGLYSLRTNEAMQNRTYVGAELIPGLATLRAQKLNAESIDGRSLERPISFVAVKLEKKGFWRRSYEEVRLIQLPAGQMNCKAATIKLEN